MFSMNGGRVLEEGSLLYYSSSTASTKHSHLQSLHVCLEASTIMLAMLSYTTCMHGCIHGFVLYYVLFEFQYSMLHSILPCILK